MYCGSCLRDNALAIELIARGHDVTLVPVYTPTLTDDANVSRGDVLFGGISVYLQQHSALFRQLPRFLDRLWDSPRVIDLFAGRGAEALFGELVGVGPVVHFVSLEGDDAAVFLRQRLREGRPRRLHVTHLLDIGLRAARHQTERHDSAQHLDLEHYCFSPPAAPAGRRSIQCPLAPFAVPDTSTRTSPPKAEALGFPQRS